jgi:hypothetical protein
MANIMEYLDWRGDLSFLTAPFCEVDNLIFSLLSYIDFTEIVPPLWELGGTDLRSAAQIYFSRPGNEQKKLGLIVPDGIVPLFRKAADSARFGVVSLSAYVNEIDEERRKQFSAVTFKLPGGIVYVAFRGTDDTIVGWKEDLLLSYMSPVPAQSAACDYLMTAAEWTWGELIVGGHSKGGNLAVYAATHADETVRNRIISVYNNDGPGFSEGELAQPGYKRIKERVQTILPQSSVVGMLLEHEEDYKVVKSRQIGVLQHNGLNWEVLGREFVHLELLSGSSRLLEKAIRASIRDLGAEGRERFAEALFRIVDASGAKTLTDLNAAKLNSAGAILKTFRELDKDSKEAIVKTMRILLKEGWRSVAGTAREHTTDLRQKH